MNDPDHKKHCMQSCIEACSHCHQVCLQIALGHCLNTGGKHVEAEHFRLMMSCAEICQASANLQLGGSVFHQSKMFRLNMFTAGIQAVTQSNL